jgi:hypothetical protein
MQVAKVVDDMLLERGIFTLITFGPFYEFDVNCDVNCGHQFNVWEHSLIFFLQEISCSSRNKIHLQLCNFFLPTCVFDLHVFHFFVFYHFYV